MGFGFGVGVGVMWLALTMWRYSLRLYPLWRYSLRLYLLWRTTVGARAVPPRQAQLGRYGWRESVGPL